MWPWMGAPSKQSGPGAGQMLLTIHSVGSPGFHPPGVSPTGRGDLGTGRRPGLGRGGAKQGSCVAPNT